MPCRHPEPGNSRRIRHAISFSFFLALLVVVVVVVVVVFGNIAPTLLLWHVNTILFFESVCTWRQALGKSYASAHAGGHRCTDSLTRRCMRAVGDPLMQNSTADMSTQRDQVKLGIIDAIIFCVHY